MPVGPSILTVNAYKVMRDHLSFLDDKEMKMINKAMFEIETLLIQISSCLGIKRMTRNLRVV